MAREPSTPLTAPWDDAHSAIMRELSRQPARSGPRVVAITGPVGAGKSTLAHRVARAVITTDSYLPDYDRVAYELRDDPEQSALGELADALVQLRAGRAAEIPIWSFHTHRREGLRVLEPADLIAVEGLHALHPLVAAHADVRVFVEASGASRWARWERLETTGERGWGVAVAREYFDSVAEPTFARFAPAYKAAAHVIVINH